MSLQDVWDESRRMAREQAAARQHRERAQARLAEVHAYVRELERQEARAARRVREDQLAEVERFLRRVQSRG